MQNYDEVQGKINVISQRIIDMDVVIAAQREAHEAAKSKAVELSLQRAAGNKADTVHLAEPVKEAWAKVAAIAGPLQDLQVNRLQLCSDRANLETELRLAMAAGLPVRK